MKNKASSRRSTISRRPPRLVSPNSSRVAPEGVTLVLQPQRPLGAASAHSTAWSASPAAVAWANDISQRGTALWRRGRQDRAGHRRQRARPRSLHTSYRTLQATQPSSPAHPTTHTSLSARNSPGTPSLMLPGVESLGSTCALMGKQSTAEILQPEHKNHRSVSLTDGQQLGASRIKPCAQR